MNLKNQIKFNLIFSKKILMPYNLIIKKEIQLLIKTMKMIVY